MYTLGKKPICTALTLIFCVACGSSPMGALSKTNSPILRSLDNSKPWSVDPYIARIFSSPSPIGSPPGDPQWSPNGQNIAYLSQGSSPNDSDSALWVHELRSHRERPLFSAVGGHIAEYAWCGDDKLIFRSQRDIFLIDLANQIVQLTNTEALERSPKCSPDLSRAAFIRNGTLYTISLDNRLKETQVSPMGDDHNFFGDITWIYREEFDTSIGFEWSPDSTMIWFFHTDERKIRKNTWPLYLTDTKRTQAYPLPGDINPEVRIGVWHTANDDGTVTWLDTGSDNDIYLPYATWHPSSKYLFVARLDRLQTRLDLLLCAVDGSPCPIVVAERDPRWVNLLSQPVMLPDGKSFLWLSERDGFSHIYRVRQDGLVMGQLTAGDWVVRSIDAVFPEDNLVYFTANRQRPEEYGVYSAPLSGKGSIQTVINEPGEHSVVFHPRSRAFIDTSSSLAKAPSSRIHTLGSEESFSLAAADQGSYKNEAVTNEFHSFHTEDGTKLLALLTRPAKLETQKKYPVLIYVYGGPHAQIVVNRFRPNTQLWRDFLASRGFLVFSVDGRGSTGRGKEFEAVIHRTLGSVELRDQLYGVKYLKTLPFVDSKRIGIFGWSYGGTMVLNALLRTENIFKTGVAVAPVTDWRLYDSAYTERYMQRPEDNPEGYRSSSLLAIAHQLKTPLLLVHGLGDDNVHFQHTALLMDNFLKGGKTFELMVYPDKGHSLKGNQTRADLYTRILRFIEENL